MKQRSGFGSFLEGVLKFITSENGLKTLAGIGSIYFGAKQISEAFSGIGDITRGLKKVQEIVSSLPSPKAKLHLVKGTQERVEHIKNMIKKYRYHPKVNEIAMAILSRKCNGWCIPEKDWEKEVEALFVFVQKIAVRYSHDMYGADTYRSPLVTLKIKAGDCDDKVILLGVLLQTAGYPIYLVIIQTKNEKDFNHIFLLTGIPPDNPKRWIFLDPTVQEEAGWYPPKEFVEKYQYIKVD